MTAPLGASRAIDAGRQERDRATLADVLVEARREAERLDDAESDGRVADAVLADDDDEGYWEDGEGPGYRDFPGPQDGDPAFCDSYATHEPHLYRALNGTHYSCPGMTEEALTAIVADLNRTCEHGLSASLCAGPGHYPADF